MGEQKRCVECGGPLPQHAAANSKYCSQDCWKAANKKRQRGKSGSELAQARARVAALEAEKARLVVQLERGVNLIREFSHHDLPASWLHTTEKLLQEAADTHAEGSDSDG